MVCDNGTARFAERVFDVLSGAAVHRNTVLAVLGAWAIYALLCDEPPTTVARVLPPLWYNTWLAVFVTAPIVSGAGQIVHRRWPLHPGRLLFGWWLIWLSDTAVFVVLIMGAFAGLEDTGRNGDAQLLAIMFAALALCALNFATRAVIGAARVIYCRGQPAPPDGR